MSRCVRNKGAKQKEHKEWAKTKSSVFKKHRGLFILHFAIFGISSVALSFTAMIFYGIHCRSIRAHLYRQLAEWPNKSVAVYRKILEIYFLK